LSCSGVGAAGRVAGASAASAPPAGASDGGAAKATADRIAAVVVARVRFIASSRCRPRTPRASPLPAVGWRKYDTPTPERKPSPLPSIIMTAMTPFTSQRLDHVAVVVTDLVRAMAFYRDVLCLREIPRPPTFDFPGAWFLIGPAETNQTLHLLSMDESEGRGRRHFCIGVDDLTAAAAHITRCGYEVLWHAKHKIPGIDRFFVYDPDGNRIELQGAERAKSEG
jgi:glyoxylase I family protein